MIELGAFRQEKSRDLIVNTVSMLEGWLKKYGWKGYDPFDVFATPFFLKMQSLRVKSLLWERVLMPIIGIPYLFPTLTRKVLRIKKTRNAVAAALLARGYLNLYRINEDPDHLSLALNYLNWLEEHCSLGYSGPCWGYPFDWQSKILIPKYTPSGVATSIVVQAFLDAYELTKEKRFKKIAIDAIRFFIKDLRIAFVDDDKICFSYTPLDNFRVHNANLWVASTLARIMFHAKLKKYKKLILKTVTFTLSDQRTDGGFYYWDSRYARSNGIKNSIDNYHMGYVIEALADIIKYVDCDDEFERSLMNAFRFYKRNLIKNDLIPVHAPRFSACTVDNMFLDINDCSEVILVFSKMYSSGFLSDKNLSMRTALWSIRNMQDCDGHFYYRRYRWGVDKTPYVRWSQAWMFYALTELLKTIYLKHER